MNVVGRWEKRLSANLVGECPHGQTFADCDPMLWLSAHEIDRLSSLCRFTFALGLVIAVKHTLQNR